MIKIFFAATGIRAVSTIHLKKLIFTKHIMLDKISASFTLLSVHNYHLSLTLSQILQLSCFRVINSGIVISKELHVTN